VGFFLGALLEAVDAVWICTWTAGHLAGVEAAAARGAAIFCEKPLAPTLAECERVAAAAACVPNQVGLVLRFAPVFRTMADEARSGRHGRIQSVSMRDDQYFPIQGQYGSVWRADAALAGGGTLIEHSIHDIDVLRMLLGDPVTVAARTSSFFGYAGIEDLATVMFTYEGGAAATLTSVWHQVMSRPSTRRLEVFCERAVLWTDDDFLGPVHIQTDAGVAAVTGEEPCRDVRFPAEWARALRQYAEPARAFLDALGARRSPSPSVADALAAHRLVDLAYRSARAEGIPLAVEPLG
jgi:predicted dehydrogenase